VSKGSKRDDTAASGPAARARHGRRRQHFHSPRGDRCRHHQPGLAGCEAADVIALSGGEAAQLRASPRVRTGLATDGLCSAHDRPVRELEEPGNGVLGRASKALRGRLAAIVSAGPALIAEVSNDKDSSQRARARW
jgi:hypothetical protein